MEKVEKILYATRWGTDNGQVHWSFVQMANDRGQSGRATIPPTSEECGLPVAFGE